MGNPIGGKGGEEIYLLLLVLAGDQVTHQEEMILCIIHYMNKREQMKVFKVEQTQRNKCAEKHNISFLAGGDLFP